MFPWTRRSTPTGRRPRSPHESSPPAVPARSRSILQGGARPGRRLSSAVINFCRHAHHWPADDEDGRVTLPPPPVIFGGTDRYASHGTASHRAGQLANPRAAPQRVPRRRRASFAGCRHRQHVTRREPSRLGVRQQVTSRTPLLLSAKQIWSARHGVKEHARLTGDHHID